MSSPDNNNGSGCRIPQRQQSPEAGNSHLTDNGKPVDAERAKDENNYREPAKTTGKIPGRTRKGTSSKSVSDAKGEGSHNPQS
ncbi:hypothetical protein TWF173_007283 [Orbilia oligospora]|uniref:Uncharacterized protein n=1 Tax=Arthrobotrys oligospora (strain ATCC 24927 / CBS 115.81 / DSM 1491) TaxID=756982 RepID=G1XP74_ARTOA|nr:hypothetical protein AOL_s00173g242 [Orbilia oligospora ATCC 24927]EGX45141.1 hypothetical protein AOL_s00173g242 [Orbilia oligospora ATCC 24927]KAF3312304.1 hypothetical protein TWF173_007283 [Orbilia oligospora]